MSEDNGKVRKDGAVPARSRRKVYKVKSIQRLVNYLYTPQNPASQAMLESLDYEPIVNVFYEKRQQLVTLKKKFWGYTGGTLLVYLTTIIGGLLIGLCAFSLQQTTSHLTTLKNSLNQKQLAHANNQADLSTFLTMFAIQASYSSLLMLLATVSILYIAPVAVGAGVTLVMQYLNGSYVHDLYSWKTLVAKILGTAFSVGSNVPVGPEGPMVHIGAAITYRLLCLDFVKMGGLLGRLFPCCTAECLKDPYRLQHLKDLSEEDLRTALIKDGELAGNECNGLKYRNSSADLEDVQDESNQNFCMTWDALQTDHEHMEIVAAGAGAGLAAAFGSPVGGVLYSFEEASTYFGKKTMWRSLICAVVAVYILQTLRNASYPGLIELNAITTAYKMAQWLKQTPFLALACTVTALMGSVYIKMREFFNEKRKAMGLLNPKNKHWRLLESVFLTTLFVFVVYVEAVMFGQCVPAETHYPVEYANPKDMFKIQSICGRGVLEYESGEPTSYNDLLTLFFGVSEGTIKRLISTGTGDLSEAQSPFSCLSLLVFSFTYLVFMALISSCAIPAGLFMPSIMMGGSFGLAFGQFIQIFWQQHDLSEWYDLGVVQPGLYALVGATSTLGGLFRASISLIVIMIEGTRGIDYIYGVLLAILISNWVAKFLHAEGVYETEIEKRGDIHHLRHDPPRILYHKKVEDIMQSVLTVLPQIVSLRKIFDVLKNSHHNGFPIVPKNSPLTRYGKLEGLVLRHQLMVLVEESFFCDATGVMIQKEHRDNYWKFGRMLDNKMRYYFFKRHQADRVRIPYDFSDDLTHIDENEQFNLDTTFIDLAPFMHRRPVCVLEGSYASNAHTQFVSLRMRHMPVVDMSFNLVGMITRKDLDKAAGHGHWRHNPAPQSFPQAIYEDLLPLSQENVVQNGESSTNGIQNNMQ